MYGDVVAYPLENATFHKYETAKWLCGQFVFEAKFSDAAIRSKCFRHC